jgi:hypothetical protein
LGGLSSKSGTPLHHCTFIGSPDVEALSQGGCSLKTHVQTCPSDQSRCTVMSAGGFLPHRGNARPLPRLTYRPLLSDSFSGVIKNESSESRVEAGSNTSTAVLLVVGGDEKGSLQTETVKYGHDSQGTLTRKLLRWRGPAAIVNDRRVLSSERAPHMNKPANVRQ